MHEDVADLRERAVLQARDAAALHADDPQRVELLIAAGDTYAAVGDFGRTDLAWDEGLGGARALGDARLEARVKLHQAALAQVRSPDGLTLFHAAAAELRPVFQAAGDDLSLYKLHQYAARAYVAQAEPARARAEAETALVHAERAGLDDVYCRYLLGLMELDGEAPVEAIRARAEQLRSEGPGLASFALQALAECNAMLGRWDEARRYVAQHAESFLDFGKSTPTELGGRIELMAGDPAAAEAAVRPVVEAQERGGDLGHGAGSLAVLARAVLEQGRADEALALLAKLERWAAPDDRWVQAHLASLRGRASRNASLVRAAVDLVEATEWLNTRAEILRDLYAVTGERAALERAIELYERKGNVAATERVRLELAERG